MTVTQSDVIDFVAHRSDEALLVMVEGRPWADQGLLLRDLEKKLNTYFAYISSGNLIADFPELNGKRVHIQLRASASPGPNEIEYLRIVSKHHLAPANVLLSWKVIGEDVEHAV